MGRAFRVVWPWLCPFPVGMLSRAWGSVEVDDRVRIDPEFAVRSGGESGRGVPWFVAVLLMVVAGLFGWFMAAPTSIDVDDPAAAPNVPSSTAEVVGPTATSVTVGAPSMELDASLVSRVRGSLSDAVPGFTDEVVMLATPPDSFRVIRWHPDEATPELAMSVDRIAEYGCSPVGLDASGSWFARIRRDNSLVVQPVSGAVGQPRSPETVGLNVTSVAWHDTKPESLAWVSCARSESGPATLYTLDISDPAALPEPLRTIGHNCQAGVWIDSWSEDGVLIGDSVDNPGNQILVMPDGTDTPVRIDHRALVDDPTGRYRPSIPGVSDDEPVRGVARAPNGTFSAVVLDDYWDAEFPKLRIADAETGQRVIEVSQHGFDIVAMAWSTNGRFLLYELWNLDTDAGELAVYDTTGGKTTHIPLAEIADQIRTSRPG